MQPDKHDRIAIGHRIKKLRLAQELTVQELAKRSAVSAGYISEVERAIPAVSIDKLKQISDGLGVSLDSLIDQSASSTGHTTVEIPVALSHVAEKLNLSHRATLTLLQGQRSLTARRSTGSHGEWSVEEWMKFYDQVKDYLPDC